MQDRVYRAILAGIVAAFIATMVHHVAVRAQRFDTVIGPVINDDMGGSMSQDIDAQGFEVCDSSDELDLGLCAGCASSHSLGVGDTQICQQLEVEGRAYFDAMVTAYFTIEAPGSINADTGEIFDDAGVLQLGTIAGCASNRGGGAEDVIVCSDTFEVDGATYLDSTVNTGGLLTCGGDINMATFELYDASEALDIGTAAGCATSHSATIGDTQICSPILEVESTSVFFDHGAGSVYLSGTFPNIIFGGGSTKPWMVTANNGPLRIMGDDGDESIVFCPNSDVASAGCTTGVSALEDGNNVFVVIASDGADKLGWLTHNDTDFVIDTDSGDIKLAAEVEATGISGDGSGSVVCVKADGNLGTCSDAPDGSGNCTCG